MGEFTRANGREKSLAFAIEDIFSATNLVLPQLEMEKAFIR
jgi:hypothetical protein